MNKTYFKKEINLNLTSHEIDQIQVALNLYYNTLIENSVKCTDDLSKRLMVKQAIEISEILEKLGFQKGEAIDRGEIDR